MMQTMAADGGGTYLHWGVVAISAPNLVIIGLMLLLFVAALVVPFPGHASAGPSPVPADGAPPAATPDMTTPDHSELLP